MRTNVSARSTALATVATVMLTGGLVVATSGAAQSATCSSVEVVFARGTGEIPGFGLVGSPFVDALTTELSDRSVSSYAVDYAADFLQTSSTPGAQDMVEHVQTVAAACPETEFVLGGYSQGATVTDKALGIGLFMSADGTGLPDELADRVAAVVVFGNPLGLTGETIATESTTYGPRSQDFCNSADMVCGGNASGAPGGHLAYATNGSTEDGAQFAAELIRAGGTTAPVVEPAPAVEITPVAEIVPTADVSAHNWADSWLGSVIGSNGGSSRSLFSGFGPTSSMTGRSD
jgi:cutinase